MTRNDKDVAVAAGSPPAIPSPRITCVELREGHAPPPGFLSDPNTKIVYLVRHGQGTHNSFAMSVEQPPCRCAVGGSCAYLNTEHEDAKLTIVGRRQARAVGPRLFVSPLRRAVETAVIALSIVSLTRQIPVVADERIRERYGIHVCDRRSPVQELIHAFPTVDFGRIAQGEDALYDARIREDVEHVAQRASDFFLSLNGIPEKSVAVFAHSAFLRECLKTSFHTPEPSGTLKICQALRFPFCFCS
jgi:broad specificity phosphatase PhoE